MLTLSDLSIAHGQTLVMQGISTTLQTGQVHVIIGPNGTGKSTLLRTLFADLPFHHGSVSWQQQQLTPGKHRASEIQQWREQISYMPQDTYLDVSMSVLEIVVLGGMEALSLHVSQEMLEKAMSCLDAAGITHLANRDIASLSGGQRQMALFAQVLMRDASMMLLDEPVSALDLKHQVAMLDRVREQTRANNWITLVVLHDLNLACQYADNLLIFANGQLKATGAPKAIINAALLVETYGVALDVLHDKAGNPLVQPLSRHYSHLVDSLLRKEA